MRKLSESLWTDIQRRSAGNTVRKEDDINHLDRDGMLDYIYSKYDVNTSVNAMSALKGGATRDTKTFSLAVFIYGYSLYRLNVLYENDKISRIVLLASEKDCEGLYDKLENNFYIIKLDNGSLEIQSKDLTVSNQLIIDIIDTINEGIEQLNMPETLKPMLIKKER